MKTFIYAFFLAVAGIVGTWESEYSRPVICTYYDSCTDISTFTDNSGNDWEWKNENDDVFEIGKSYTLIMDDNHSSSIYDDLIKKIK